METLEFDFMAAKKSTIIWLKIVELNNFPGFLKDSNFNRFKAELIDKMILEMVKEKLNK